MQTVTFGSHRPGPRRQPGMAAQRREGLIRHVGVSNYSPAQIEEFSAVLPAETVQPPYHLFRRGIEATIVGARTPAHLAESLGALDLPLSQADLAEIDRIMAAAIPMGGPTPEGMS